MLDAEVLRDLEKNGAYAMEDWASVFTGEALKHWQRAFDAIIDEDVETALYALEALQDAVNPADSEAFSVARAAYNWFQEFGGMDGY